MSNPQLQPTTTIQVDIGIRNNQEQFFPGDLVVGNAEVVLPEEIPLSAIVISFNCIGEVQWVEHPANPHYLDGHVYHDQHVYHREVAQFTESGKAKYNHRQVDFHSLI